MTFGVDATSHATVATTGVLSLTWAHTCGAGANKLLATGGQGASGPVAITGATYNGVALTSLKALGDSGFERAEIWRINNPPTGSSLNIVLTYAFSVAQAAGGGISFNDALATEGAGGSGTGIGANPSFNVTTVVGDIVVSVLATDLGADGTTTENGVLVWEDEDVIADSDFNCQRQVAVSTTTSCSWTSAAPSAGEWAAVGVPITGAPVGASVRPMMPLNIWGRNKLNLSRLPSAQVPPTTLNNYLLAANTGVYTLVGSAAKTTRAAILAAATGTYSFTGISALTAWGHKLLANTGVFVLTGSSASVLATRVLAAIKGTFTLTGNAAATLYKRIMIANTGSFTLTGNPSTVVRTYVLNAAKGIFSLTGVAASTIYSAGASVVSDWLIQFRRRRR